MTRLCCNGVLSHDLSITPGAPHPIRLRRFALVLALSAMLGLLAATPVSADGGSGALDGTLLFLAYDRGTGVELWKTDGTEASTTRVADISPGPADSNPFGFAKLGDRLYFSATDDNGGRELWRTGGGTAGTKQVEDIRPGAGRLVSLPHHEARRSPYIRCH